MYLANTALTVHDVNHIIHIIETGKLPNLEELFLAGNNLSGMEAEVDRLIDTAIIYHKEKLVIDLLGNRSTFPRHLVEKWQTKCSGTTVKLICTEYDFVYQQLALIKQDEKAANVQ